MSTKKGNISKQKGIWGIAPEFDWGLTEFTPIHPSYLQVILEGDSLKPEYQGEVEYEEERAYEVIIKNGTATNGENYTTYATPKPVESKGDVWEEAWKEYRKNGGELNDHLFLNYLKQHYTLAKKQ